MEKEEEEESEMQPPQPPWEGKGGREGVGKGGVGVQDGVGEEAGGQRKEGTMRR